MYDIDFVDADFFGLVGGDGGQDADLDFLGGALVPSAAELLEDDPADCLGLVDDALAAGVEDQYVDVYLFGDAVAL